MAKMLRPYAPQNVVGDFKNSNEFYLGDETDYRDGKFELKRARDRRLFARMAVRQNRHYLDILQSDGKWHSYPVDYTIGSKFQQAYATKLPNGEIHVFPIQYNVLHKQWINFCAARCIERSEEHTSELQSRGHLVCRLLLEKKKIRGPVWLR